MDIIPNFQTNLIESNPPFGDFMGMSPEDGKRMPLVLQTSGGK